MAELANLADIGERETVALSIGNDSLRKSPTYVGDFSWVPPALREDGASSAEFFPDRWTTKSNPARSKFVPPPRPAPCKEHLSTTRALHRSDIDCRMCSRYCRCTDHKQQGRNGHYRESSGGSQPSHGFTTPNQTSSS